jgi:hypothetical protein
LNYSPAVAAEAWLGCCAALITKSGRIANTRFEKIRCRAEDVKPAANPLSKKEFGDFGGR